MDVIIRSADEEDFGEVLSLMKEFSVFQKTPEKVTITLPQMILDKDIFRCLVAETPDKKIVGFATYFFAYYSWSGKAIYLDDLYVKQDYQKNAIGKKLLETTIQFAKDAHCTKLRWQVSKWNENAIGFYKSIGAHIDETDINCDLFL